jgi:phosphoserine phosphatase RsbU/P
MRILVADDEKSIRTVVRMILEPLDYCVVEATNGREALEIMTSPNAPPIALIDWKMPQMDGLEVCKRVRNNEEAALAYIILVTAQSDADIVVRGLKGGADDFLAKPFNDDELLTQVRRAERTVNLRNEKLALATS